jgi:phosphotransferase system enzyme I (PtsI)
MGLPAVLGASSVLAAARSGQTVIVDGDDGRIVVNPDAGTLAEYRRRAEARARLNRQLARLRTLPATTLDGTTVGLQANIELSRDVDGALNAGAEGIGLFRTEFMFMNRDSLPGEEEQYALLRSVVEGMKGRMVTIRTLDVGGEKLTSVLGDNAGQSANPMLGLRAIRFSLKQPKLFEAQLSAILRAGAHGPVRLLLPMISSVHQVRQVKAVLKRVSTRLRRRGVDIAEATPLGVMIEVPGAALIADSLAQEVDFFAIGTNDLTMYTLAIDRGDEQVAGLYNPLHPAVLRLIQFTVGAAQRAGKPVSICGEVAGDPRFASLLVGLGVRELSMASQSIPRVKQRIRALDTGPATRRALAIMDQAEEGQVSALLDDFNENL